MKKLMLILLLLLPLQTFSDGVHISNKGGGGVKSKLHNLIDLKSLNDTTISGSFVTLRSSSDTVFSGRPVMFILNLTAYSSSVATSVEFSIQIDSGSDNVISGIFFFNQADTHTTIVGIKILSLTVGSHVINLRWRRPAGAGIITMDSGDQALLYAVEL